MTESDRLRIVRRFDVPPRSVFDAFTDPDAMGVWWTPDTVFELDLRVGGRWRITRRDGGGCVATFEQSGAGIAAELRARARDRGTSVSKLLAEIVTRETRRGWPEGWLDRVAGSWNEPWPTVDDPPPDERRPL